MRTKKMFVTRRLAPGDSASWQFAVEKLVALQDRDGELVSIPEIDSALKDDRCYLIIAELESEIVGLLSAYRFPDLEAGGQIVYLYDIEVEMSHRKNHIGTQLVRALISHCDVDDVDLIWAGTEAENISARALFETTGANLEGESYVEYEWDLEDEHPTE